MELGRLIAAVHGRAAAQVVIGEAFSDMAR
jgi:hypothetical protein